MAVSFIGESKHDALVIPLPISFPVKYAHSDLRYVYDGDGANWGNRHFEVAGCRKAAQKDPIDALAYEGSLAKYRHSAK